MPHMVWVEIGDDGRAVRLFKNLKATAGVTRVLYMLRASAVEDIRRQVWERDNKRCTHCGTMVGWHIMQLHERVWRGRGGAMSVENGCTLCADCHQNSEVAGHGTRQIRWSK